jgi:hypothetical protein
MGTLLPVSEQHRHVHGTKDEDDVEPGILEGCHRRHDGIGADVHYNGYQNARHRVIHQSRHHRRHRRPH